MQQEKRRCSKCGEMRAPWEYHIHSNGKKRSQCRYCMNAKKTDQPSTTQGVRDGRSIIEARLGEVPGGCMIPPTSMGKPPTICPWYVECKRRERDGAELLMCEVEDSALNIPLMPKAPARLPVEADGPWWFSDNK